MVPIYNNGTIITNNNTKQAIDSIRSKLLSGTPIIIGVGIQPTTYVPNNNIKATVHFMVVRKMGRDKDKKIYFGFYDPGRSDQVNGASDSNILTLDNNGLIKGSYPDDTKTYTITEVDITSQE